MDPEHLRYQLIGIGCSVKGASTRTVVGPTFRGQQLLYLVGHSAFDTACCGMGGCAYALVPGIVHQWKTGVDKEGLRVSEVEPIRDEDLKKAIRWLVLTREVVQEVKFQ